MDTVILTFDKSLMEEIEEGKTPEINFLTVLDHYDDSPFELYVGKEYDDHISLSYKVLPGTIIVAIKSPEEISVYNCGRVNDGLVRDNLWHSESVYSAIFRVAKDYWKERGRKYLERMFPEWFKDNVLNQQPA